MNWRVWMSLILAGIWLIVGLYFLLQEQMQLPFIDSHLAGWISLLLMLWNLARAGLVWSKPKRSRASPF